jgi:cellulose synthase/poly-beta-1,6-N-acetylglucosamine synthase-like glycosyltransferase/peptidoglycan/xylan/chitin deacetylase (PgdA/CDA1 family)
MAAPDHHPHRRATLARWALVATLLVSMALALFVDGVARHVIGRSSTAPGGPPVPALASTGPVVDFSAPEPRSVRPAARQVALTFDDGPDPRWTPALLEVLRRQQVPATFFVIGAQAAAHPELVRAELRQGHEVGAHTFTHTDLGAVPAWRSTLELTLTQSALAGAAGINTHLLRLPYSSFPGEVSAPEEAAAEAASRFGYLLVFATTDGEDWRRPGINTIVARATPRPGEGAVVLLHDGGGDRSQTIAAVDRLITNLKAQGYRFTTVSEMAKLPPGAAGAPVGSLGRLQGLTLLFALRLASLFTRSFAMLLIAVGVLAVARGLVVVILAHRHVRAVRTAPGDDFLPGVSVVVPAFNEEVGIAAAVRSLLRSDYPTLEVVVVDDGSTDATAEIVAGLGEPDVTLIRQPNGGKPAALNTGIARARHDVIVMVDGDTVFEPDTIRYLVQPMADPDVGAVSGNTKVGNRKGLLGRWQHIEYVIGFNLDRRMYDVLRCMPTVPGAIGAFRRAALIDVGGVSDDTLAEDTDLTMALNRAGWRVSYEERARAWTEAPGTLGQLWRQRYRWCYGTMQAMWKHRRAVREGTPLGRVGLPYLLLFQVLLPLLAPAIDLFALYGLAFFDPGPVAAYWLGFNALQLAVGAYAFGLDGERRGPLLAGMLQQFVYRQLMYLVVIQSVMTAAAGTRLRWHKLVRTGDVVAASRAEGGQPGGLVSSGATGRSGR